MLDLTVQDQTSNLIGNENKSMSAVSNCKVNAVEEKDNADKIIEEKLDESIEIIGESMQNSNVHMSTELVSESTEHVSESTENLPHSERILLNVSGSRYETYVETLERFPTTLLGDLRKRQKFYSNGEYYFDRNRVVFDSILFFYQSFGRLTRPSNVPMSIFENECRYFDLPDEAIVSMKTKEGFLLDIGDLKPARTRRQKIWYIIQYPESSKNAMVFSIVSIIISTISVFLGFIESIPSVQKSSAENQQFLFIVDFLVTLWFVIEITVSILAAPISRTIRRPMTYIDFIGSYPYLFFLMSTGVNDFPVIKFCRICRLFKLMRLFRIFTSSKRTETLTRILASSLPELFLLFLCLMIIVFLGASLIYMIESRVPGSQFTSVPACSWWALQTVVVLGYGDLVPETPEGKLLASVFMICGVTTISLPVLSVASKFLKIYEVNL
ncbi:shaker-related potassium channel tsha2-like [Clytia hemisphaerica]|uniref:Uncharacterized protein n=1 Tax=Clytia hemisphaerica TaxID=252671 RepID=A0A7M5VGF2_9CNID